MGKRGWTTLTARASPNSEYRPKPKLPMESRIESRIRSLFPWRKLRGLLQNFWRGDWSRRYVETSLAIQDVFQPVSQDQARLPGGWVGFTPFTGGLCVKEIAAS